MGQKIGDVESFQPSQFQGVSEISNDKKNEGQVNKKDIPKTEESLSQQDQVRVERNRNAFGATTILHAIGKFFKAIGNFFAGLFVFQKAPQIVKERPEQPSKGTDENTARLSSSLSFVAGNNLTEGVQEERKTREEPPKNEDITIKKKHLTPPPELPPEPPKNEGTTTRQKYRTPPPELPPEPPKTE